MFCEWEESEDGIVIGAAAKLCLSAPTFCLKSVVYIVLNMPDIPAWRIFRSKICEENRDSIL